MNDFVFCVQPVVPAPAAIECWIEAPEEVFRSVAARVELDDPDEGSGSRDSRALHPRGEGVRLSALEREVRRSKVGALHVGAAGDDELRAVRSLGAGGCIPRPGSGRARSERPARSAKRSRSRGSRWEASSRRESACGSASESACASPSRESPRGRPSGSRRHAGRRPSRRPSRRRDGERRRVRRVRDRRRDVVGRRSSVGPGDEPVVDPALVLRRDHAERALDPLDADDGGRRRERAARREVIWSPAGLVANVIVDLRGTTSR